MGFSSDKRFAREHKRAIKGLCSAIDSLRPLVEEMDKEWFNNNVGSRLFSVILRMDEGWYKKKNHIVSLFIEYLTQQKCYYDTLVEK